MAELSTLPGRMVALEGRMTALESQVVQLRGEMKTKFSAVRSEIRAGDEETRRHASVLHEEVMGRLKLLREGAATGSDARLKRGRRTRKN